MSLSSDPPTLKRTRSNSLASSETSSNKRAASEELMNSSSLMGSTFSRTSPLNDSAPAQNGALPDAQHLSASETLSSLSRESSGMTDTETNHEAVERPSGEKQLAMIKELMEAPLVLNETRYIVARSWYRRWSAACAADKGEQVDKDLEALSFDAVGPIDNSSLLVPNSPNSDLAKPPLEGQDAEFLPQAAWALLMDWYGLQGTDIPRRVISYGQSMMTELRIEFFPPRFTCLTVVANDATPESTSEKEFSLSQANTLSEFRRAIWASFNKPTTTPFRAYRLENASHQGFVKVDDLQADKAELVAHQSEATTLTDAQLDDSTKIAVEWQLADGTWLVQEAPAPIIAAQPNFGGGAGFFDKFTSSSGSAPAINQLTAKRSSGDVRNGRSRSPKPAEGGLINRLSAPFTRSSSSGKTIGVTGLGNLGNTCFMNSALQCLSNTTELRTYFTSPAWRQEINKDNPLGMAGAVAEAYGDLIKQIWSGRDTSVTPRAFKQMIGRFRPMFIGWNQQDSQEFLSFLLDGLHEDLNRIYKKPATVKPEWEGGGDLEMMKMALESWDKFKLRNDSVIVDLFQGMYRSTVICPDCSKVSITFDAFTSLTLPMPAKQWSGVVFVQHVDRTKPLSRVVVSLPKEASYRQLKRQVAQILDLDPNRLLAFESYKGKIWKWHNDPSANEIVASPKGSLQDFVILQEMPVAYPQGHNRRKKDDIDAAIDAKLERACVPVYSAENQSIIKGSSSTQLSFFGNPYMLLLDNKDATSYDAIYEALVYHFAGQSKNGALMYDWTEDSTEASVRKELDESEATANSTEDVPITEFEQTDSQTDPVAAPTDLKADVDMQESKKEYTLSSLPAGAKPNPNLFKIFVNSGRTAKDNLGDVVGSDGASSARIALEERIKKESEEASRESASTPQPPGGFIQPTAEDDKDLYKDVESSTLSPEVTVKSLPVIRTGDTLVCQWTSGAAKFFFDPAQQLFDADTAVSVAQKEEKKEKTELTLDSCLNEFSRQEKLDADNTWYCPTCKELKEATKQVDLWSAPDVLVIHLKRFSAGRYGRDKISDFVDFPLEGLDLSDRTVYRKLAEKLVTTPEGREVLGTDQPNQENMIYDLFAVDNHFGGLGGGHYTAYAKNAEDNLWYNFDDSSASPVSNPEKTVKSTAAYLLFYRKRTDRQFGGKTVEIVQQSRNASAQRSENGDEDDTMLPSYSAEQPAIGQMNVSRRNSGDSNQADSGWDDFGEPTYPYPSRSINSDYDGDYEENTNHIDLGASRWHRWNDTEMPGLADSSDPDDYGRSSYNYRWSPSAGSSTYRPYTDTDSEFLPNIHLSSSYGSTREQTPEATEILPEERREL